MTDPISDMLTQIRNALLVKKSEVVLPYSRFKHNLSELLLAHGRIERLEVKEAGNKKFLHLILKYGEKIAQPAIAGLRRISKPGQRIYAKAEGIGKLHLGSGITIISTSKGLMTSKEARQAKVGGEVICQIW